MKKTKLELPIYYVIGISLGKIDYYNHHHFLKNDLKTFLTWHFSSIMKQNVCMIKYMLNVDFSK